MQDILDRPPIDSEPPELPPFLRKRRGGGGQWLIMPSIIHLDAFHLMRDTQNNWQTAVYLWMVKWRPESGEMYLAHSHSRKYRQWLETYDYEVLPHIVFAGALESREADPTFFPRWVEWAKEYFA